MRARLHTGAFWGSAAVRRGTQPSKSPSGKALRPGADRDLRVPLAWLLREHLAMSFMQYGLLDLLLQSINEGQLTGHLKIKFYLQ